MGTPTLIGVPEPRGAYTARHLRYGEHPDTLVPVLRRIWAGTFARDTAAMTATLLTRDWSHLDVNRRRHGGGRRRVSGIGYPAPAGDCDGGIRHGRLGEDLDGFLEWLYLLQPEQRVVVVYEATRHARWLRHSLHYLEPVEELFVTEPEYDGGPEAMTVCTVCGAIDEIEHHELPSMVGYGFDTCTACQYCGSSVTTDPMFGAHVTRKPWPPHPTSTPAWRGTP